MTVKNYKDLIAWQKSMVLVKEIYDCSKAFPKEEQYSLTSQIRRAAISIPSNIAYGSLAEVETQIYIAEMLGYTQSQKYIEMTSEIARILSGLITSLEERKITKLSTLNSNN